MTTATKPRSKSALVELEQLERQLVGAKEASDEVAKEHGEKVRQFTALQDQRRKLVHHEPGLVDHQGQPNASVKQNPVSDVDKQIAELGDLADLQGRREHAGRLEAREKQRVEVYVAEHFDAICADFRPAAEAAVAEIGRRAEDLRAALDAYIDVYQRAVGLTGPVQGIDGRHVPGVNHATELREALPTDDLPVPVPDPDRRFA